MLLILIIVIYRCALPKFRSHQYPSFGSAQAPKELRNGHPLGVRALSWTCDGSALVSCGHDRVARVWNPERNVCYLVK